MSFEIKHPELYDEGMKFGIDYDLHAIDCHDELDQTVAASTVMATRLPLTPERSDFLRCYLEL